MTNDPAVELEEVARRVGRHRRRIEESAYVRAVQIWHDRQGAHTLAEKEMLLLRVKTLGLARKHARLLGEIESDLLGILGPPD